MASVVNQRLQSERLQLKDHGYEVGAAVMPVTGLTAKAFYIVNDPQGPGDKYKILNTWGSYAMSGFTFAGEYNTADFPNGGDGGCFLAMANYASGPWGATLRYSNFKIKDAAGFTTNKDSAITVSPNYKVGDNWLIVSELRRDDFGGGTRRPLSRWKRRSRSDPEREIHPPVPHYPVPAANGWRSSTGI